MQKSISTGAGTPHRNFTSPPSLWPGRELREYHCPSDRIMAGRPCQWSAEQTVDRSSFSESRRQSDPCSPVRECNRNADMKLSRFKNPSTSFMGTENREMRETFSDFLAHLTYVEKNVRNCCCHFKFSSHLFRVDRKPEIGRRF